MLLLLLWRQSIILSFIAATVVSFCLAGIGTRSDKPTFQILTGAVGVLASGESNLKPSYLEFSTVKPAGYCRNMYGPPPECKKSWLDEKQSAKVYPASSGEWSPGA